MTDPFIDTNILVRFLTGDDVKQQAAAATLLEAVEAGKMRVIVPLTVLADTIHVLCSPRLYNRPSAEVAAALIAWIRCPYFRIRNRGTILVALNLFATRNIDFSDCLIVSLMRQSGSTIIYSFDKDFDHVTGITRKEP